MPDATDRACDFPGCGRIVKGGRGWLCDEHKNVSKQEVDRARANDPTRKLYQSAAWKNLRVSFLQYNETCQRMLENEQCHAPTKIVHHLIDPDDRPDLMFTWSNLVGVCAGHHCHQKGEVAGHNYTPTRGPHGATYPHPKSAMPAVQKKSKGGIDWDEPFSIPETA